MHYERRDIDISQPLGAAPGGHDGDQLSDASGGEVAPVERLARIRHQPFLVEAGRAPPDPEACQSPGDVTVTVAHRRRQEQSAGLLRGLSDIGITRRRHDRCHREQTRRMLDRHGLNDHPSHRHAHDVGALDPEVVEDGKSVGRHL